PPAERGDRGGAARDLRGRPRQPGARDRQRQAGMRAGRSRRHPMLAALLGILAGAALWNGPATAQSTESPHDATSHESFKGVEKWTRIFDDPKRDEWQKPQEVVLALALRPGQIVADLGAGTGYFEKRLSKAVAPGGIVLAIDTEPEMVRQLGDGALHE